MDTRTVYLAGGCFWGLQKFFDQFEGVLATEVGYANGPDRAPSYEEVCANSGHAETVKITYDEDAVSLEKLLDTVDGDEKTGVKIVLKALEEPVRQIAHNAGFDGGVVIDKIVSQNKIGYGFDAYNEKYVDMFEAGIIDPTKVSRSALQNAASVASTVLTTESLVVDIKEPEPAAPAGGMGGGMGMY